MTVVAELYGWIASEATGKNTSRIGCVLLVGCVLLELLRRDGESRSVDTAAHRREDPTQH